MPTLGITRRKVLLCVLPSHDLVLKVFCVSVSGWVFMFGHRASSMCMIRLGCCTTTSCLRHRHNCTPIVVVYSTHDVYYRTYCRTYCKFECVYHLQNTSILLKSSTFTLVFYYNKSAQLHIFDLT